MLAGREAERAAVRGLLDQARNSCGSALVIHGLPGVGKSTLLAAAAAEADGFTVLRTSGIESESPLAFAALQRLVRPVLRLASRLPAPQARSLRRAFGEEDGEVDRFLVFLAALSLLAEAAEQAPVLAVIDDAHWLDDASAAALLFVARRLQVERIALLFAARDGDVRRFEAGLPDLTLDELDATEAGVLLTTLAGIPVPGEVLDRLVTSTGGNPLALVELANALPADQLSGRDPLPAHLPLTQGVERAFLDRVGRLPSGAQSFLLVAAADDSGRGHRAAGSARPRRLTRGDRRCRGLRPGQGDRRRRDPAPPLGAFRGLRRGDEQPTQSGPPGARRGSGRHRGRRPACVAPRRSGRGARRVRRRRPRPRRRACRPARRPRSCLGGLGACGRAHGRRRAARDPARGRCRCRMGRCPTTAARALAEAARAAADSVVVRADVDRLRARIEWNIGSGPVGHRILLQAARDVAGADLARATVMARMAAAAATFGADSGIDIDPTEFVGDLDCLPSGAARVGPAAVRLRPHRPRQPARRDSRVPAGLRPGPGRRGRRPGAEPRSGRPLHRGRRRRPARVRPIRGPRAGCGGTGHHPVRARPSSSGGHQHRRLAHRCRRLGRGAGPRSGDRAGRTRQPAVGLAHAAGRAARRPARVRPLSDRLRPTDPEPGRRPDQHRQPRRDALGPGCRHSRHPGRRPVSPGADHPRDGEAHVGAGPCGGSRTSRSSRPGARVGGRAHNPCRTHRGTLGDGIRRARSCPAGRRIRGTDVVRARPRRARPLPPPGRPGPNRAGVRRVPPTLASSGRCARTPPRRAGHLRGRRRIALGRAGATRAAGVRRDRTQAGLHHPRRPHAPRATRRRTGAAGTEQPRRCRPPVPVTSDDRLPPAQRVHQARGVLPRGTRGTRPVLSISRRFGRPLRGVAGNTRVDVVRPWPGMISRRNMEAPDLSCRRTG
ncbi:MAG: ATP-binding protein [Kineosporiaceae bacterium]|nr:ATP-binding protein [Kineosporiaceae bacterium]